MKKVTALLGSLSRSSSNKAVVEYLGSRLSGVASVEAYDAIRSLPQFDPDLESDPPKEVIQFRRTIRESDGILISTPEYVFAVPGALKNAIDWTVSTAEFREKPTALVVASLSGEKAYESLLLILGTIEARIDDGCSLLIPHIKAKVADDKIVHEQTIAELDSLADAFAKSLE